MEQDGEGRVGIGRVLLWFGFLLTLPIFYFTMSFRSTIDGDDQAVPRCSDGHAYLLVGEQKYLFKDKNRDGKVDCLVPTGVRGVVGYGTLRADEEGLRCSRFRIGVDLMDPGLRATLSTLLVEKLKLGACHTSCIDLDGDASVDCVVSVHNPKIVVLEAPGAQCAAKGHAEFLDDQRQAYSEILALEQMVRAQLLDEND